MELYTQIKKYRTNMNLSQEELAEKIYVTRQTISNWENNKNYPDIHSLLLLSSLFDVSLDQLIKGDIEIMKKEIDKLEQNKFNKDSTIFGVLLLITVVSVIPLTKLFGYYGLFVSALIWLVSMYYAFRIEKIKKDNDIHSYKEIVSFVEGKRLDEIETAKESGKSSYQKILMLCVAAIITFIVLLLFDKLI